MKRCPACQQTYQDDALSFCLNDGVQLVSATPAAADPQQTLHIPAPRSTAPSAPPQSDQLWGAARPSYATPVAQGSGRSWLPWILGLVALLIVGIIGIVFVSGFLYYKLSASSENSNKRVYNSNRRDSNSSGSDSGTRNSSGTSSSSSVQKESLADSSTRSVTELALERVGNFKLEGVKSPQGHLFKNEGADELMMATYDRTDGTNFVLLYMAAYSSADKAQSALEEIIRWSAGQGHRIQSQETITSRSGEQLGKKYVLRDDEGVEDVYWTNGRYAFNVYNGKNETGVLTVFEKAYPY
jgi:hypothetical protein